VWLLTSTNIDVSRAERTVCGNKHEIARLAPMLTWVNKELALTCLLKRQLKTAGGKKYPTDLQVWMKRLPHIITVGVFLGFWTVKCTTSSFTQYPQQ
jgi:hypothetical protein